MKRSKAKRATSKGSRLHRRATPLRGGDDIVTTDDIDWNTALDVEIDPKLAEAIRARARLRQVTLRVGTEQIAEARRVSARTGIPYQAVLRRWLAEGASLARSLRKAG
jgi:predicted DNA binding CopG/RHH family protein